MLTQVSYLGDTLGAEEGVEEPARARVRCAWAKFKELSPILTAYDESYHTNGNWKDLQSLYLEWCIYLFILFFHHTYILINLTMSDQ